MLVPVFDPGFVPVSYGFWPNKSAHNAVRVAQTVTEQGYRRVIEVDLGAFFDRVNHDALMTRVARKVKDKRLLGLIRRYLEAGIMADGVKQDLLLRVNRQKSTINPAGVATLLGYAFFFTASGVKLRIAPKALKRAKVRIKQLTSRKWSISMGERIQLLNRYIRGWMGYFRLADTTRKFTDLNEWFRRGMRQIQWKEWKRPRTRVANLGNLGIRPDLAWQWGSSRSRV